MCSLREASRNICHTHSLVGLVLVANCEFFPESLLSFLDLLETTLALLKVAVLMPIFTQCPQFLG